MVSLPVLTPVPWELTESSKANERPEEYRAIPADAPIILRRRQGKMIGRIIQRSISIRSVAIQQNCNTQPKHESSKKLQREVSHIARVTYTQSLGAKIMRLLTVGILHILK